MKENKNNSSHYRTFQAFFQQFFLLLLGYFWSFLKTFYLKFSDFSLILSFFILFYFFHLASNSKQLFYHEMGVRGEGCGGLFDEKFYFYPVALYFHLIFISSLYNKNKWLTMYLLLVMMNHQRELFVCVNVRH